MSKEPEAACMSRIDKDINSRTSYNEVSSVTLLALKSLGNKSSQTAIPRREPCCPGKAFRGTVDEVQ